MYLLVHIVRVNMNDLSIKKEEVPDKYKSLGGRSLTSTIVYDEVTPTCEPLGPFNKFIVAPGIVTGSNAPSSGRLSVGAKSPLTHGIKESNAGGITPQKLARLGIKALIIEGLPKTDKWYNLVLTKDKYELVEGTEFANMGNYELIKKMWEKYPNQPGIIGCGIAGQKLMRSAGVFGNNIENTDPGRYAGRGGLGAVLGTKRIVAIITDDHGCEFTQPVNKELYDTGRKKLVAALMEHAITGPVQKDGKPYGALSNFGTNVLHNILNEAGALPVRNWTKGQWDGAAKISGEATHEYIDAQKALDPKSQAQYSHPCHKGCVMQCSNVVTYPEGHAKAGEVAVSCLEYESVWALGSNCEISDYWDVVELNRICNDLGLDTIEAGNTLGVAMEAGIIKFGDGPAAIELLKKVASNDPVGHLLGLGALGLGQAYGVTRVAHTKGQSLPAYDPRPIKGMGVVYAVGTMGGDHTQGYTIAPEILQVGGKPDPRDINKSDLSRAFLSTTAFLDSTGYCLFTAFAILDIPSGLEGMVESVKGYLGVNEFDLTKYGMDVLRKEREFNKKAGFTKVDDRLPEWMTKEPLPPHNVVFDVPDEELDKVFAGM
jgi:aldehyde:ferredoxin oxidoreductase